VALGVSADSVAKQAKFRDKYQLNMPLLADTERQLVESYGVAGKLGIGTERTTFIIGKDGLIKKVFPKVKVEGHVEEILQELDSMQE
jgi:thioredoxin-dependent peroxiredoxin